MNPSHPPLIPQDSPALQRQSDAWPTGAFGSRVPKRIKVTKTVHADILYAFLTPAVIPTAHAGTIYPVYVNTHGAVAAILPDGTRLGVKFQEFEVIEFHE